MQLTRVCCKVRDPKTAMSELEARADEVREEPAEEVAMPRYVEESAASINYLLAVYALCC